jgi:hypothetical protein
VLPNTSTIGSIDTSSFAEKVSFLAFSDWILSPSGWALAIVDLDGDGRPDIVTGGISVLRNTGGIPNQVTLLSPEDRAIISSDTVLFVWQQSQPAVTRYRFELATDSMFTDPIVDSTVTDTTKTVRQLINSQTYWWRVRANNVMGWGSFSEARRFTILITAVYDADDLPKEFSLNQNYPNPFNPSTHIQFALPQERNVKLEIFNLLGERIAILVDEKRQASYYSERFDATGLASGVYFYRLQTGDFVDTKKLLLLK